MTHGSQPGAVVAKRADNAPIDTDEIRDLATAAGYAVSDAVVQARPEDPGTHFGSGKVETLARIAERTDATAVLVDAELTPTQATALREAMPAGTRVLDRYQLVLELFADQATTRVAQLQVELARLRYERPRIEAAADPQPMNVALEKGTIVDGIDNRIASLERSLADVPSPAERHRERRRETGFDLVTLAGYTNAGKSTLLHRLADDLSLADRFQSHPDMKTTAAIEDRLFKTLETTTRRATLGGRPTLVTDTVGFVSELPHWLVESFSATLSEAAEADVVVLVVDGAEPAENVRAKTQVAIDVLEGQGVEPVSIVTAVNKLDAVEPDRRGDRVGVVESLAPKPVPVSVRDGTNLDALVDAVRERLPTERASFEMPVGGAAMNVVSWAYDRCEVHEEAYIGDRVRIDVSGRPEAIEQMRAKASTVRETGRAPSSPRR